MDFAFSTVILFLIIVPGLVARFFYFTHPFAREARSSDLVTELLWSLIPGFLIQFIFVTLLPNLFNYDISFEEVGFLLAGKEDNNRLNHIMNDVQRNIWAIIGYQSIVLLISGFLGYITKVIVRALELDKKTEFFQFSNKWFYIMSGEILDMDDSPDSSSDIDITGVDVLCNVGDEKIIYKGELIRYYLSKNGDLDSILIRYPSRRSFNSKGPKDPDIEIPSHILFIPNKDIININIRYVLLNKTSVLKALQQLQQIRSRSKTPSDSEIKKGQGDN